MNFFKLSNNEKNKWRFYDSKDLKTNWEAPNLIDLLDVNFFILCEEISDAEECTPDKYVINNAIHISLNNEIIEEVLKDFNLKYNKKFTYYQMKMSIFLEDILANEYSSIIIYGDPLSNGEVLKDCKIIDKHTVLKYSDVINIHNALESIKFGNYSKSEYYEKIKNYNMYFIGNKVLLSLPKDENGNYIIPPKTKLLVRNQDKESNKVPLFLDEILMKSKDGFEYKAVKVFASYYSASTYGGNEETICEMPLWKIKELYNGPVIVEPHRNWWVEF